MMELAFNPLPDMPNSGSSNSAAIKDIMPKIWINEDTIICLSRKHCEKWRNCSFLLFPQCLQKQPSVDASK